MSIRQRWQAWQIVVVATFAADAMVAWRGSPVLTCIAMTLLAAMLALLVTTPADAIVLPRGRSEAIIVFGDAAYFVIAYATQHASGRFVPIAGAVVIALLAIARVFRLSAWWVALVAWNPALVVAARSIS